MKKEMNSREKGFTLVEAAIAIVMVGLIAFVGWRVLTANKDAQLNTEGTVETEQIEELPEDISGIKQISEIQQLSENDSENSEITGIEFEVEDGRLVYVVMFANGNKVAYDAQTGEKVSTEREDPEEDDDALPTNFSATISISEAIEAAKNEQPGKKVEKVELEAEDGEVVYSVRFTDDSRVDISATTGVVTDVRAGEDEDNEDAKDEEDDKDESDSDVGDAEDEKDDEDEEDEHDDEDEDHDDDDKAEEDDGDDDDEDDR